MALNAGERQGNAWVSTFRTWGGGRGVFILNLMTLRKTASAWHDRRHFVVLSEAQRDPCWGREGRRRAKLIKTNTSVGWSSKGLVKSNCLKKVFICLQ